jgi:anti-anti-sigma regulatory factor
MPAMEITVSEIQGPVAITVLHPYGPLDASNYQELVNKAHAAYDAGSRHTPYMSSSGIVALHTIALLLQDDWPEVHANWSETSSFEQDRRLKKRVKLISPPPRVDQLLEMAGFKRFIETYTDMETAISAFLVD